MASFISTNETLERRQNGVVSRTGGQVRNLVLEVAAGVEAGRFVCPSGTAGIACENIDSQADAAKACGLTVFRPMAYDADLTDGAPHYAENEVACILEEGYMFVDAEGTVVAGQPVYARTVSDGGSNTVLGKARADSDLPSSVLIITPVPVAAVVTQYSITLSNGTTEETFIFTSDASPTAAEVAAGLVALIDASVAFTATGTVTVSVGAASGIVDIIAIHPELTVTTPARAQRVPNAFFAESRTGAGLVEVRLTSPNR